MFFDDKTMFYIEKKAFPSEYGIKGEDVVLPLDQKLFA